MRVPRLAAGAIVLAALVGPTLPSIATTTAASGVATRTVAVLRTVTPGASVMVPVSLHRHDHLVGVTWAAGAPTVSIRWHIGTTWTAWSAVESDTNAPNAAERAQARPGTEPAWLPDGAVGATIRIGATRPVQDVRVVAVGDVVHRILSGAGIGSSTADAATGTAALGHVYTRHDWGAKESLRRCGPDYASTNVAVIVHHTAQTNSYSPGAVPGMIRSDYTYHVQTRGWCDIGYNLLVDRFGRIWEGRYGGIGRAVIGAHAEGFNTGTVGVAFLGTSDHYYPPEAAVAAFARVGVYAATTWHFDPASTVVIRSGGSPRYADGKKVRLPRMMGHRDTGQTDCPGTHLYADIPNIRVRAHDAIYAPKFTWASVTGAPVHAPSPVTIRLGISRSAHWSIAIKNSSGQIVSGMTGTGTSALLQWDGQHQLAGIDELRVPYPEQDFTWVANASLGRERAHPVTGHFHVGSPYVAITPPTIPPL